MTVFFINKKYKIVTGLVLLFSSGLLIWSCHKRVDIPEPDVDLSVEQTFMIMLADLNSIQGNIDSAFHNNMGTCASLATDSVKKYLRYTIAFNGSCNDNLIRTGTIEIYHSGIYSNRTLRDSIVYKNFTIGDRTFRGNRIVVSNADTIIKFRKLIINEYDTISFSSGKSYRLQTTSLTWNDDSLNRITTIYGGFNSLPYVDEIFSVSIASPSTTPPTHFTSFPLIYKWNCADSSKLRHPVSGALTFTNKTLNSIKVINFERATPLPSTDPNTKLYSWAESLCGRDTATYVSPKGNIYYFNLK